jgi:hypothetical protein
MNTRIGLSKIRGFNLGPRFDKYRTLLDMSSYNQKQLNYALSKPFRALYCIVEHTTRPTEQQLGSNWVKLGGATVFALFYRHD